ncbi:MAG: hypothetical protein OQK32_00925, partial [Gammaproteobacteria bacterium]|nr:hypothetical protein [Gammaproteobacteria bacterium]
TNPSLTTALTGLAITDTYPTTATKLAGGSLSAAITTSTSPDAPASNSCGGTLNVVSTGLSLTGGSLAPGASCTIEVDVWATDTTPAIYYNTTSNIASDQGIGVSGADSLIITTKPTIEKSFLTSPIILSGGTATTTMRIIVENNSGIDITDVSFSDTFPTSPSQMVWVSTDANTCGGTLTVAAGDAGINLTGGAISSGLLAPFDPTCTIDITVEVSAPGDYYNTTDGATSSVNTEVGPVSNTAQLVAYLEAPTVTKTFASAGFQVNGTNRLTITLTNPNTVAINSMGFTDTYPANLLNAAAPNLANTCGGTATAAAGAGTLNISGGSIPASSSCSVEVDLTATAAGVYTNTLVASSVTSVNASPGPAADVTADTTAYLPPTLTKVFGSASINVGGSASMWLTLTNPASNTADITNLQVDDTFPAGMTLQDISFGFTPAACGSVTRTDDTASVAGDGAVRLKVATLAAGASCEASINITSSTQGAVTNTTDAPVATAPVTLTGATAWDSISVLSAPSIMLLKSVQTISDPVNLGANPKAIPGAVVQYNIIATNSGASSADVDSTVVLDPIPANTVLYADDIGGPGPVLFTQGVTSSTLTFNSAVDVSFSDDGGGTWTATPSPDATTGCDTSVPAITHIRANPKGTFIGSVIPPSPSFQLSFRVCIQ